MRLRVGQQISGLLLCSMLFLCTVLLWYGAARPVHATSQGECTHPALQALAPADTTLTAVTLVSATTTPTTLPEYCQVDGYVTTPEPVNQVNFRLGLPTVWNHKLGFDHGVGHSLLLLNDAKAHDGKKIKYFNRL